jgi:hypothetical protein
MNNRTFENESTESWLFELFSNTLYDWLQFGVIPAPILSSLS